VDRDSMREFVFDLYYQRGYNVGEGTFWICTQSTFPDLKLSDLIKETVSRKMDSTVSSNRVIQLRK
jgi:hypothetical protein